MGFKYQIRTDGIYFLTFTVVDWIDVFTRPELANVVIDSLRHCQKEKGLDIYAWCIMSSHVHLIASAGVNGDLSNIMRDMKKFTSKQIVKTIIDIPESRREWLLDKFVFVGKHNPKIKEYKFWQDGIHPIEIYSEKFFRQKLDYIHENPVEAGLVWEAWQYRYSSAIDYWGKGKGLLETEVMGLIV